MGTLCEHVFRACREGKLCVDGQRHAPLRVSVTEALQVLLVITRVMTRYGLVCGLRWQLTG